MKNLKPFIHTLNLPKPPNQNELESYLNKWGKMENYRNQENALNKLFHRTYPQNNDLDEVLVKVATLNDFYSTNIFNVFAVAKHILGISRIDSRLQNGDEGLVGEIEHISINGKAKYLYSFATKFCTHHNDADFAIYDSYVKKVLVYFKDNGDKEKFRNSFKNGADLKDYPKFKKVLDDFKDAYNLKATRRQLDKYLWQLGRKYFPQHKKNR